MIFPAKQLPSTNRLPHVHVVVPCYRYGHFLEACINSIVSQTGVRTTVHIIDDASPDDSFAVAERLAAVYPSVTADKNEVNLGHIATYNKGLSRAKSDYLVLLSADDLLAPGALQRATALMEIHPEVGLTYGHPQAFETEPVVSGNMRHSWSIWSGQRWIDRQFRRGLSIIYSPEAVVRTSLHHEVGYYQPELPHSGDLEVWLRLAGHSAVGRINGPDQAYRRVHPASMMHTAFVGVMEDLRERRKAFEWFLNNSDMSEKTRDNFHQIMRRRLAEEALAWAAESRTKNISKSSTTEAVDFAVQVYPESNRLAVWGAATTEKLGGFRQGSRRAQRILMGKLRWRRWRHFGL